MTKGEVADRADLHLRHYQKIEDAEVNVTMATLTKLGAALDVDPADLLRPSR